MDYRQGLYPIIKKSNLSKNCYDFTVKCDEIASIAVAGQFAHVKADGFTLRRPISICQINRENGTIRLVFEVRGDGTAKIAELNAGSMIDIIAPLGNGFTMLDKSKKAITVGGGIGTPPMLAVSSHYGNNATAIIGFRSSDAVILKDDFISSGADVKLCTDDGTAGMKGYVSASLEESLKACIPDIIYACGPHLMLKSVIELADKYGVYCEVSLEERMGCGVGACLVCACRAVKNGQEYLAHVCKDGPVFSSHDVIL